MVDYRMELEWDRDDARWKVSLCERHYNKGFYFVSDKRLRDYSVDAQAALQRLVYAVRDRKKSEYPGLERAVAAKGYDLYRAFFIGSDAVFKAEALRLKGWVAEKLVARQDTITFVVRDHIHIPWGLFYDQPVPDDDPGHKIDRENFWCMKYNAGAHYFNCAADGVEDEWRPDEFQLLLAAHKTVWDKVYCANEAAGEEWHRRLERLLQPDQPKFLLDEAVSSWEKNPYGLLAFYCHGAGDVLSLGADTISATRFSDKFSRDRGGEKPPTLVFLAGCETAVGDLESGFLKETSGTGFCGFIGTEVRVPDRLTLEFLSEFLAELYGKGGSVFSIMRGLRDKYWPLSLVFSMCCARDLRLTAPVAAASPLQPEGEHPAP